MITDDFKEDIRGAINAATLWLVKEVLKKANITPDSQAKEWKEYLRESKNGIIDSKNKSFYDKIVTFARHTSETLYGEFLTDRMGVSLSFHVKTVSKTLEKICIQSDFDINQLPDLFLMTVDFKIAGVIVAIAGNQTQIYGITKFGEGYIKNSPLDWMIEARF